MENKDAELCLGLFTTQPLPGSLNILLKLLNGVLESCAGVVNLINDEHLLADKVLHLANGREIKPLGARDLCTGGLDDAVALFSEGLVQGETDRLDGNIGRAGLLQEAAENARRDVTATANGDHELGLEVGEDLLGGLLAQLVHLLGKGR